MDPLTLSNGMRIPRGATLVLPTGAINLDGDFFESPQKFEGFRFYQKRQQSPDEARKHQLVTVGKYDLAWGYGRHACPGRYMADVVMKLVMIEFLVRYDIKYPTGTTRPENIIYEGIVSSPSNFPSEHIGVVQLTYLCETGCSRSGVGIELQTAGASGQVRDVDS